MPLYKFEIAKKFESKEEARLVKEAVREIFAELSPSQIISAYGLYSANKAEAKTLLSSLEQDGVSMKTLPSIVRMFNSVKNKYKK